MKRSKIIAEGFYLPSNKVSNAQLMETVDTTEEWIVERTGILFRHISAENEYTSDLAAHALSDAFKTYNIDGNSIDGIIVATATSDQIFPSTAAIVQDKLGIANLSFCFDISAVCAGFIYALSVADSMIKCGAAKRIAVIGAETFSKIVDWKDRSTCVLFGDGAGAVILEASDEDSGIIGYNLFTDGGHRDILKVDGGVSLGNLDAKISMNGREVFKSAVEKMSHSSLNLLDKLGYSSDQINWLLPHQANSRIFDSVANKIKFNKDKVISTIAHHANTSAASIPLAYSKSVREGKIIEGNLVMMTAFGAGLSWGSLLLKV